MAVFALVDCNNFYVSCERVFDPRLEGKPVIVLSNNDGCAVARSNEVKQLDIRMGAPVFKEKDKIRRYGIQVLSSNYALYGDMSQRVVQVLSGFCPDMEVYSIDESFLDLSHMGGQNLTALGRRIGATVKKHTGIPVSVGIAQTKTLAKIAGRIAKKSARTQGVLDLSETRYHDRALEITEVEDIWGVGRRYAKFLRVYGITNARELRDADAAFIRKKMGINGLRLIEELKGRSCYPLDSNPLPKKNITVSRSFGRVVGCLDELREAMTSYATRGSEKLRSEKLVAGVMAVFLMTDRFRPERFYYHTETVRLSVPTNNSPEIIRGALSCLESIYKEGCLYKKAGIFFHELGSESMAQRGLFDTVDRERSSRLMDSLDRINASMGKDTLRYASSGLSATRTWPTVFNHRSPAWTTRWDQLPLVR
ncbi:MAG: Y-family DNA polymerase [Proteobacteria bacterium]|nr:Y-family DNA polymerase [Pseudomonadota bacterium]